MMWIHPGILAIIGAVLIPFVPFRILRKALFLSIPLIAFTILVLTSKGYFGELPITTWKLRFSDYELILGRIDSFSIVFAYVFAIIAICANIYSVHIKNDLEHVAAMIYFGSTICAVFAGDLLTLYIFWEMMAISAVFLIWFRGTKAARGAGFRYLIWHIISGSFLLSGIVVHVQRTGSTIFTNFMDLLSFSFEGIPYVLILLSFMINAAVVPLHSWLTDSYPEASITGVIYMNAFTTKTAVYTLARAFPGLEILAWLGAVMAVYGVIFAAIVNDGRRLLSYHIVSQVGYMVCGVGLGTQIAINGAIAHAFNNIIFKSLLFMGMGAVIESTGRSKFTELGGLYKYIPLVFYLYTVGALSIYGFPLFSGFVSKTMIVAASAELHLLVIYLLLKGATIGTLHTVGLKLPWSVWFSRNKPEDLTVKKVPKNMIVAMFLASFLCIFFGTYPGYKILYEILPYQVKFEPYEPSKIIVTVQLFIFATLAFLILRKGYKNVDAIVLDTDWPGRILGIKFIIFCETKLINFARYLKASFSSFAKNVKVLFTNPETTFKQSSESSDPGMGIGILIALLFMLIYLTYLIFI